METVSNAQHLSTRFLGDLCTVPYRNDPDHIVRYFVEEPVRRYDHLSIWQIRELRYNSLRFRKILESAQGSLCAVTKTDCR